MEHIVIPDIYCPFPSQINPYLEQVEKHSLEWARGLGLIQKDSALRYHAKIANPLLTCTTFPQADLVELLVCNDWYLWLTVFDDQFDDHERGTRPESMPAVHQHLQAILQNSSCVIPRGPIAQALSDIWQRACQLTSSVWQKRFAQHHMDFFSAQRQNALNRALGRTPERIAYIRNRRDATALSPSFDLIELVRHMEIPDEIHMSFPFQAALQAAEDLIGWTNDVYSLRKELAQGDINNLVVVVQHERNCSLQEAVNEVCAMIERETRRFQELVQHFSTYSDTIDRDIRTYLDDVGIWARGLLDWTWGNARYEDVEYFGLDKAHNYVEEEILPL